MMKFEEEQELQRKIEMIIYDSGWIKGNPPVKTTVQGMAEQIMSLFILDDNHKINGLWHRKIIKLSRDNWIGGISDGLTLPCGICNRVPPFDYHVDDKFWKLIVGDHPHKRGVICLPCLDKLAFDKGHDVSTHLERVQFTGIGKTIELKPSRIFHYEESNNRTCC